MNENSRIPFMDLVSQHEQLEDDLVSVFKSTLKTARFIGGPMVENFENDFADFCSANYCVGVSSGTDALRFALIAAGVKKGDMVLTVPNTFIATTEAISQAGALPDFVDIDDRTYNLDPAKLRDYLQTRCVINHKTGITENLQTKRPVTAVVPVHLYGQMADMDPIMELAEEYKLKVIEDACQAHGAEYYSEREKRWRRAGSMGQAAAFSFYPGKNLGACGEGGAVTTNDGEIAQKVRMLRDHGQARKYYHEMEGYNGRLDAVKAGVLQIKLKHLQRWNEKRRSNANRYNEFFMQVDGIVTPYEPKWSKAVYHLYIIRSKERDELQKHLSNHGVDTGLHYPIPLHLQNPYKFMGYEVGDFPVAESIAAEILSLPMYPELTTENQKRVADSLTTLKTVQ